MTRGDNYEQEETALNFDDIPNQVFYPFSGPGTQYSAFVGAAGMGLTPYVQSLSPLCLG